MARPLIVTTHLYFVRSGDAVDGDTVSSIYKPDIDPVENWNYYGEIASAKVKLEEKEHEHWGNSLGTKELKDVLISKQDLRIMLTTEDLSPMTFEMLYGSGVIDTGATGAYVPCAKRTQVKGWFKIMQYDNQDQLVNTVDVWGTIKIGSGEIDFDDQENLISVEYEIRKLSSALNSGALQNI